MNLSFFRLSFFSALLAGIAPSAAAANDLPAKTQSLSSLGNVRVGDTIPWFAAQTLDDKVLNRGLITRQLAASGGKGFVVAFFATWCGPCRVGLKMLGDNRKLLESSGIRVYLVDATQDGKSPAAFLEGLNADGFIVLDDPYLYISKDYGLIQGAKGELTLPKTFVAGKDARALAIFSAEGQDYITRILQAVAEK